MRGEGEDTERRERRALAHAKKRCVDARRARRYLSISTPQKTHKRGEARGHKQYSNGDAMAIPSKHSSSVADSWWLAIMTQTG
eukprot:scaffold202642_cov39-Tisochrysis_lutea.AAC.1